MARRRFAPRRGPFGSFLLGPRDQSARRLRYRTQALMTGLLVGTNLGALAIVIVVNLWAIPGEDLNDDTRLAMAIGVPTYAAFAFVVGITYGTSYAVRALRWALIPRNRPDPPVRLKSLRVPLMLTLMQFALWQVGALGATAMALVLQPMRALPTFLTVFIAGVMVAGISYLLSEFALRPIAARALEGVQLSRRVRGAGVSSRMLIFWAVGTGAPVLGLLVTGILVLAGQPGTRSQLAVVTIVVCAVVLVFGFGLTDLMARSVRAPLVSLREATEEIQEGNFDVDVLVYDGTELGLLQSSFNGMVAGLREREKIRDLFSRHVGHDVAEAATAAHTGEIALAGETRVATVLFVDLVGSTAYATTRPPSQVVEVLNRFFAVVVDEVDRHHGLVNKFMGDAVLAVFGAPVELDDHAGAALAAARGMAARLHEEVPELGVGIGIASGQVVAGNVGHEQRFEYTVIGDAVNAAARLTDLAKQVPGHVLADWDTVEFARASDVEGIAEAAHWTASKPVRLRGRSDKTRTAVLIPPKA